jgi:predicted dehydrogenase
MALNLTREEKVLGQENFQRVAEDLKREAASDMTRRDFMKSLALTGAVVAPVSAAAYFKYADSWNPYSDNAPKPVRTALIGGGDEGGVLIGEHNPKYIKIVAVADFRPYNMERIFVGDREEEKYTEGELKGKRKPMRECKRKKTSPRLGLDYHYKEEANSIVQYKDTDAIDKLLADKDKLGLEAVIIALPLHLHAPIAIKALNAKLHVLCEKLMAWNITLCKDMIKAAQENDRILSIGHQRHYSMLYAHAVEMMQSGVLGDVHHIRALWHRNNGVQVYNDKGEPVMEKGIPVYKDSWKPKIPDEDRAALEKDIKEHGYKSMEELVRWRLYNRTGGGLMAELGSHQLDACSIFLGRVHPLAVTGVGGKYFYRDDREVDDHVFVTFEFPGLNYYKGEKDEPIIEKQKRAESSKKIDDYINDKDDKVIVTYSSISTNQLESYGECIMGTKGSMIVELEKSIFLYPEGGRSATATLGSAGGGKPALESSSSTAGTSALVSPITAASNVSKGYREEMEHFAYCIRMRDQGMMKDRPNVRCDGEHAMADAIIALTSNLAMKHQKRIEFDPDWFDPSKMDKVPDKENVPEIITG